MTDVFISYSRKDIAFARLLHQALIENGLETWIDWQDIPPSADWLAEVYQAIEEADAFVFVISETSLTSEICSLEIAHAHQHNKRLIPIVIKDVDAEQVPRELSVLNWIFFEEAGDRFEGAMEDLVTAITVDQVWVKGHTRFENRALDWERKDRDRGLLLRGTDLNEAEAWLAGSAGKDPQPTALQTEFILKSREDATRRQRTTLIGVGTALVVAVGLGILAWTQRNTAVTEGQARATQQAIAEAASTQAVEQKNEAERQANLARTGQLSVEALSHLDDDFPLSLLLSVEAVGFSETVQSRSSLLTALTFRPQLLRSYYDYPLSATNVAYSPDGSLLVTAGCGQPGPSRMTLTCESAELIFYDAHRGDLLERVATKHPVFVSHLIFSPDGTQLASSDWLGNIILWNTTSRKPLGEPLVGASGRVLDMLYTPGGDTLLASYELLNTSISPIGGEVWYWDTKNLQAKNVIHNPTTLPFGEMELAGNGNQVITTQIGSSSLSLRDLSTFDRIPEYFQNNDISPRSMALSPDGRTLALGNHNGSITFWDVKAGILLSDEIQAHTDSISDLAYSLDGAYLVSASADQTIKVWDAATYEQIGDPFVRQDSAAAEISFLPGSHQFAAASGDGSVKIWDLDRVTSLAVVLTGHDDVVWDAAFTSSGYNAASASADGTIRIWDLNQEPALTQTLAAESGQLYSLDFSPDERLLAVGGQLGWEIWDWQHGERLLENRNGHTAPIVSLAFNPSGDLLATGGMDTQILLWNPENGELHGDSLLGHQNSVNDLAFSPDGQQLVSVGCATATSSVCESGQILLWNLEGTPVLMGQIDAHDRDIYAVAISPDGSQFATASTDETVQLWDLESGERVGEPLMGHEFGATSLAFSPDGKLLASGGFDHNIMLTDQESRQRVGPLLEGHQGEVNTVAFSPDGNWLLSGSHDGLLYLWPLGTGLLIDRACQRAGRNLEQEEWNKYLFDLPYQQTCPQYP